MPSVKASVHRRPLNTLKISLLLSLTRRRHAGAPGPVLYMLHCGGHKRAVQWRADSGGATRRQPESS